MQKFDAFRSRRLLDSAKGQTCQNCGVDDGTIVCAHSNASEHGKGGSIKAADCFVAYLCFKCHAWYDQDKPGNVDPTGIYYVKHEMWERAHYKTLHEMFKQGIIQVK